jgi:hypothetical protein
MSVLTVGRSSTTLPPTFFMAGQGWKFPHRAKDFLLLNPAVFYYCALVNAVFYTYGTADLALSIIFHRSPEQWKFSFVMHII